MISAAQASQMSVTTESTSSFRWRAARTLSVGDDLGQRYTLRAELGRGGSGTVFRAWDSQLECPVAVKIFEADARPPGRHVRRLQREVRIARGVRHPNVCPVFDLGQCDGHWFMTMELAAGTLSEELSRTPGAPNWANRARDARDLVAGLSAIHTAGITHADVAPRNILRMNDGRLALADFGMARLDGEETELCGGTLSYVSPEVVMGARPDRRSDVWQLGLVLHEVLLGTRPRWRLAAYSAVAEPALAAAPPATVAQILRVAASCLAWDPGERPASAVELDRLLTAQARRT